MLARVRRYLSPPFFQDAEQNRVARIIHVTTLALTGLAFVAALSLWQAGQTTTAVLCVIGAILGLVVLVLSRRGYLTAAGVLLLSSLLGVVNIIAYRGNGIHDTVILLYPATIIAASLLLDRHGFVVAIALTILSACLTIWCEMVGLIRTPFRSSLGLDDLVIVPIMLSTTALAARFLADSLRQSLTRVQENESALQGERDFARQVMETMGQGLAITDTVNRFTFVNAAFASMLGYQPQKLIGKTPFDLMHPDERSVVGPVQADRAAGKTTSYETRLVRSDGQAMYVLITSVPRHENDVLAGTIVVITDLTERRQLEWTLTRRAAELQALYETGLDINAHHDLTPLLHAIVERAARLIGVQVGTIYLLQPDQSLELAVGYNVTEDWIGMRLQPGEGLAGRVVQSGKPIVVSDYDQWEGRAPRYESLPSHRVLSVPLRVRDRVIGTLNLTDTQQSGPFSDDDVRMVSLFADQAAVALENARQLDTEQRRVSMLTALNEAARQISGELDLPTLLKTTVAQAAHMVDAPMGTLYLMRPDEPVLEEAYTLNLPPEDNVAFQLRMGEGLSGRAAQRGEAIALDDYGEWPHRYPELGGVPYHAMMAVPIKWHGQVLGTVGLIDTRPARFGPEQISVVSLLAAQAGIAIQNARLFEAIQMRIKELQILHLAAVAATEANDEDVLIERVTDVIGETLGPDFYGVLLLDPALNVLRSHPSYRGIRQALRESYVPIGRGVTGQVALQGQPRRVPDVWQVSDYIPVSHMTRSELAVPLKVADRVLGVLNIESIRLNAFSADDESLMTTLAGQLATAIERLRARVERERLIVELESKNAELERFTYTVSHDLKSPLITIRGFLGFLERDAAAGNLERFKTDMARIVGATEKMKTLLDDLLELSRIGRLMNPPEAVSFGAIAQEAVELVRGRIEARGVQVEVAPNLPVVYGDRVRLVEVLQNLVDNAVKFTGDRPRPQIEIGQRGTDADGKPIFFVHDNGVGIEPQYHHQVFGLFNKLDAQTEGTGIGLTLVKRIVEVHGGRIWVESQPGQGATFCFTLPPGDQPAA